MLFNESIKENILYCKPDASDEDIHFALRSANAHFVIDRLAEGIDTNVGTSGS